MARKKEQKLRTRGRFPERVVKGRTGPLIDYKEIDLLRRFLTTSLKVMSRKRGGTSAAEQRSLKLAVKRARFMALLPYTGT